MPKPIKVYFYCQNDEWSQNEDIVILAEGFRELGIEFSGSCNYWLESTNPNDYLIRHDPKICPDDCDIIVVSSMWPFRGSMKTFNYIRRPLPEGLFKKGRRYKTVYMDNHDGYRTVSWEPEFRQFDLILRSKLNQRAWYPTNMRPWAYGFWNLIIQAATGGPPFLRRRKRILINFGASHPYRHGTRELAKAKFEPQITKILEIDRTIDDLSKEPVDSHDALMWRQSAMRFSRTYYERLKQNQAMACFCGELIPPAPFNPAFYMAGGNKAKIRRAFYEFLSFFDSRPNRSIQWDSFRFWEALMAGCVAFNIDLEHYGVYLPVMPENWKHYIGIDFDRVDKAIERILDGPNCLEDIAAQGRQWALENYSPRAMAERFLKMIGYE